MNQEQRITLLAAAATASCFLKAEFTHYSASHGILQQPLIEGSTAICQFRIREVHETLPFRVHNWAARDEAITSLYSMGS